LNPPSALLIIILVSETFCKGILNNLVINTENYLNLVNEKNVVTDIKVGGSTDGKIDVYYDKEDTRTLKPVVIFVHGGFWVFGNKYQYSRIGSLLVKEKYVAVLVDYLLFPKGNFDDMVDDIYKSIAWTYENISKYGGDKNRIILSGHSAGAHLCSLTTLKTALKLKNHNSYLNPLPPIQKLILFNGLYDFDDFDFKRILDSEAEVENGIVEKFISKITNTESVSPTDLLKPYKDNSIKDLGVPEIIVYYTGKDEYIPELSATNLMKQLRRTAPNVIVKSVYRKDYDHGTLIKGVQSKVTEQEKFFMEIIRM